MKFKPVSVYVIPMFASMIGALGAIILGGISHATYFVALAILFAVLDIRERLPR